MPTFGEELTAEITRVRDHLIPQYQSIGASGAWAVAMMRHDLESANKAVIEGDLGRMITAYESLRSYES